MKRPTIRDVAEKSGYSIATVSMALSKKDSSIPQRTKDVIATAARALGYRPNRLAVSLLTKKSMTLGLIIPDNGNMFFAELSKAVESSARGAGYNLIYGNTDNDPERDIDYIGMFIDRQVDGIVFARSPSTSETDAGILRLIRGASIPFVMIDRSFPETTSPTVLLDHFKGGRLATQHLIENGHRRIGCFTGPPQLFSSIERLEGYRSALSEAGIPFDESLLFEGNYQMGKEREAFRHFMEKKVSAVFSFNDFMALGLYREAKKAKISIPDDLSILGFDDIQVGDLMDPPLTTVHQPIAEIGKRTVEILLQLLDKDGKTPPPSRTAFEPTLVIRESVKDISALTTSRRACNRVYGED